jgi:hypothetical protein
MITSSTPLYYPPITATTPMGPWTSPTTSPIKRPKLVGLPERLTGKVLIAFLEDDTSGNEAAVWAARLAPINVSMDFDQDGGGRIVIELSLADAFGE